MSSLAEFIKAKIIAVKSAISSISLPNNDSFDEVSEEPILSVAKQMIVNIGAHLDCIITRASELTAFCNSINEIKYSVPSWFIQSVITAPLVDHAGGKETPITPTSYSVTLGSPQVLEKGVSVVDVNLTATGVPQHTNGAGSLGYWVGVGISKDMNGSNCAGWIALGTDFKTLTYGDDADSEYNNYKTFYFGYNPNSERVGYIAYKYNDEICVYRINFNIQTV